MKPVSPLTVTLGVVAILFGLAAAYGAKRLLEPKPTPPPPAVVTPKPVTTTVLVAQTNLTEHMRIRDQDVAAVEVPPESAPAGAMTVKARTVGRFVKTTIVAGHAVREEDIYKVGEAPQLADQLPPGSRAVALKVDDANTISGLIQPGCHVDVSLTFDSDHPEVAGMATVNIMRRLKVMPSAPTSVDRQGKTDRPERYITVAATPEQANQLILAQSFGTVNVTLCSTSDDGGPKSKNIRDLVSAHQLLGLPAAPLAPVPEEPVQRVVEIYRGSTLQKVVFDEEGELLTADTASVSAAASGSGQPGTAAVKGKKCKNCGKKKVPFVKTAAGGTSATPPAATEPQPTPAPPQPERPRRG